MSYAVLRSVRDRLFAGERPHHLFLRGKRLSGKRPSVPVIAPGLPVVMAAVGIKPAAVRVSWQGEQEGKRKAYDDPKDQRGGFHGEAIRVEMQRMYNAGEGEKSRQFFQLDFALR